MARKDYTGAGMSRLLANYARAADMAGEITISDFAAEKIRKLLARAAEGHRLRIKVVEGGGSGIEYKMNIHSPQADD